MKVKITLTEDDVHEAVMDFLRKKELSKIDFFIRSIDAPRPRKGHLPAPIVEVEIELGIPF